MATSFRALMSSGVISPGCGSYHLHFIKTCCETTLISQSTRSFHDASSWVGGSFRRVAHQELSGAVRGQDPDPWPGEARPSSCHLSDTGWDHPSGWERPTMGGEELARSQTTSTWRQKQTHTHTQNRHVSCTQMHMNKYLCVYNDIHAPLYACTMMHARAILGNHQHNLWCCPHESLPHRQSWETEVTYCHQAEQTQINSHKIWL